MAKALEGPTVQVADVCFVHWPVARETVADLVPHWCTVDESDGEAWVSVVAMDLDEWAAAGLGLERPARTINVRTYVRTPTEERAIHFCSLDVTDGLAAVMARGLLRMPYHRARIDRETVEGERRIEATRHRSGEPRAQFVATVAPKGEPSRAAPDTMASFLTERYRYALEGPLGTRLLGSVGHEAWGLQPADVDVQTETLLSAAGIEETRGDPIAHFSPGVRFRVGPPVPTVG